MASQKTARGEARSYFESVVLTYTGDECLIWPYARSPKGYAVMKNRHGSNIVSRAVCEHVNGPGPTPSHDAAHSCGNGREGCVSQQHLRWATKAENSADRDAHGTTPRGAALPQTKLSPEDVRAIRAAPGVQRVIAEQFGVTQPMVSLIKRGKARTWVA